MSDNDIKKSDANQDDELISLDEFLNENDDGADPFPLDDHDDDFAFHEEPKKKSGFGKLLAYTAVIALVGGVAFGGYKYLPQLAGTSELSEFEQNMMNRADNFSDPFGQVQDQAALNQDTVMDDTPMPEASDMNASPELDVVVLDEGELGPDNNDLSISNVDVTIIPEGEPLPDDVAAMIGENNANTIGEIEVIDESGNAPVAATISEALKIANEAKAIEQVEDTVDAEIQEAFDQDFPIEDMPSDSVAAVDESSMGFNRIPAAPMTQGFNEMESNNTDTVVVLETDETNISETDTILVTEVENEPVVDIETDKPSEVEVIETAEGETDLMDDLPDVQDDTMADTVIVVEDTNTAEVEPQAVEEVQTAEPEPMETAESETVAEPVAELVAESVETSQPVEQVQAIPSAPKVEPVQQVAKPAPKVVKEPVVEKYSINNADQLNSTADPRVVEGQRALAAGDFDTANRIFTSVLASNPSNIHALTGKQMAVSKIRVPMPSGTNNMQQNAPVVTPQQIINAPVPPTSVTSLPSVDTKIEAPADSLESFILQMNTNPRDANAAVDLAQAYARNGQSAKAVEWYQKALQLDALYQTGINRMAVYDALAGLQ